MDLDSIFGDIDGFQTASNNSPPFQDIGDGSNNVLGLDNNNSGDNLKRKFEDPIGGVGSNNNAFDNAMNSSPFAKTQRLDSQDEFKSLFESDMGPPQQQQPMTEPPPVKPSTTNLLERALMNRKQSPAAAPQQQQHINNGFQGMQRQQQPMAVGGITASTPEESRILRRLTEVVRNPELDPKTRTQRMNELMKENPAAYKRLIALLQKKGKQVVNNQQQGPMNGDGFSTNFNGYNNPTTDPQQQQHQWNPQGKMQQQQRAVHPNQFNNGPNMNSNFPMGNENMMWNGEQSQFQRQQMMQQQGLPPPPYPRPPSNMRMRGQQGMMGGYQQNEFVMSRNGFRGGPMQDGMGGPGRGFPGPPPPHPHMQHDYPMHNNNGMINDFPQQRMMRHPGVMMPQGSPIRHSSMQQMRPNMMANNGFQSGGFMNDQQQFAPMQRLASGGQVSITQEECGGGSNNNKKNFPDQHFPQQSSSHHQALMDSFDEETKKLVNGNYNETSNNQQQSAPWKLSIAGLQHRHQLQTRLREAVQGDQNLIVDANKAEEDIFARSDTMENYNLLIAEWLANVFQRKESSPEEPQISSPPNDDEADANSQQPLSVGSSRPSLSEQNPMLSKLLPGGGDELLPPPAPLPPTSDASPASTSLASEPAEFQSPPAPTSSSFPPAASDETILSSSSTQLATTTATTTTSTSSSPTTTLSTPQRGARRASGKGSQNPNGTTTNGSNPYSVDSGFGSPKSNTSTSLCSPKIQGTSSPSLTSSTTTTTTSSNSSTPPVLSDSPTVGQDK